jgi:hypothetical protein
MSQRRKRKTQEAQTNCFLYRSILI